MTSKSIIRTLLIVIATIAMGVGAARAELYTWSDHDITFDLPEGGMVTYVTNQKFEIMWDDMTMLVQLRGKAVSKDDAMMLLSRSANGYNMYDVSTTELKLKGMKCYTLNGTLPDGTRALLGELVSKTKGVTVEVSINYLFGNLETAEDIMKSFEIGKKQDIKSQQRQNTKTEKKQNVKTEEKSRKEEQDGKRREELRELERRGELHSA